MDPHYLFLEFYPKKELFLEFEQAMSETSVILSYLEDIQLKLFVLLR